MPETSKPQGWHVEVPGVGEPVVVAGFVTRQVAEDYRDEYNEDVIERSPDGVNPPDSLAYACLCDCPDRECRWLL